MRGGAVAFGAVSLVNAIAGGKGATVSVGLSTEARVELSEGRGRWVVSSNGMRLESPLLVESAGRALLTCGRSPANFHGSVETVTSIPIGVGLKSSSSSSVAVAMAVIDALGERKRKAAVALKCSVDASLKTGASITGALDDAASCMLGGVNMADNLGVKLLSSRRLRTNLTVLIRIPKQKSRRSVLDLGRARRLGRVADSIFSLCQRGAYWAAMTLNGLFYSQLLGYELGSAAKAVEFGALGAGLSGTGPSVAAVFDASRRDAIEKVRDEWTNDGAMVLRTTTNNRRARFTG